MARFNMGKIKGNENNEEVNVVDGLLNSASQTLQSELQKTEFVKYSDIIPNPRNKMSMDGIEELASLIEVDGLQQPVVVLQQADGKYRILGGERRYTAVGLIRERGKWNKEDLIEVKIKDLDKVNLPLDDEDKEMFEILVTNQAREKTDADRAFEIKNWKNIISKLRKEGINILVTGYDEDGNPIGKDIKGIKTQAIVADQLGISPAQVAKYDKVENQGAAALKEALYNNKISVATAAEIASEPKETQENIISNILTENEPDKVIKKEDVLKAVHKEKHASDSEITEENNNLDAVDEAVGTLITDKIFKSDIGEIVKSLKKNEGKRLDGKNYAAYLKKLEELKKIMA